MRFIGVRVKAAEYAWLAAEADRLSCSLSHVVRLALKTYQAAMTAGDQQMVHGREHLDRRRGSDLDGETVHTAEDAPIAFTSDLQGVGCIGWGDE